MLQDNEDYADFVRIIQEFLPERELEILREPGPVEQIAKFASYFEDRYFPLSPYLRFAEVEEYGDLSQSIPLIPLGFSSDDYDNLAYDGNAGAMVMTFLFQHPYGDQGARVALGEACQAHVSVELLKRIPEQGFTTEELHQLLDGTPYASLAVWGDLLNLSTRNEFLDTDEEMMANSVLPDWNAENVAYFTRQWAEAQAIRRGPDEMMDKFTQQPEGYLREVLDFIDQRQSKLPQKRRQLRKILDQADSLRGQAVNLVANL
jgi:hypothetical protein